MATTYYKEALLVVDGVAEKVLIASSLDELTLINKGKLRYKIESVRVIKFVLE